MSTPCSSFRAQNLTSVPPQMQTTRMPLRATNFTVSSQIYTASSRVGLRSSDTGIAIRLRFGGGGPSLSILAQSGNRYEAVFPDPVYAQAIKSRRMRYIGIACFYTGVGVSYYNLYMLFNIVGWTSQSWNESMVGISSLTSTGMSSYFSKLRPVSTECSEKSFSSSS